MFVLFLHFFLIFHAELKIKQYFSNQCINFKQIKSVLTKSEFFEFQKLKMFAYDISIYREQLKRFPILPIAISMIFMGSIMFGK